VLFATPYDSVYRSLSQTTHENLDDPMNGASAFGRDVVTAMSAFAGTRIVANVETRFSAAGVPQRSPRVWNQSTGAWTALIASPRATTSALRT
jgi:hypothetical protein